MASVDEVEETLGRVPGRVQPDRQVDVVTLDLLPVVPAGRGDVVDVDVHPVVPGRIHGHAPDAGAVPIVDADHGEFRPVGLRPLFKDGRGAAERAAMGNDHRARLGAGGIRRVFRLVAGAVEVERTADIDVGGADAQAFVRVVGHDV